MEAKQRLIYDRGRYAMAVVPVVALALVLVALAAQAFTSGDEEYGWFYVVIALVVGLIAWFESERELVRQRDHVEVYRAIARMEGQQGGAPSLGGESAGNPPTSARAPHGWTGPPGPPM